MCNSKEPLGAVTRGAKHSREMVKTNEKTVEPTHRSGTSILAKGPLVDENKID